MNGIKGVSACLVLAFLFISSTNSQTVDSIRLEQSGDLIKIHYQILNSNQYQVFRVSVFCSINNGLKSELKSLSGDFGENVVGGRPGYMVLWDVLKDVDEVNEVEFSVKAELLKDESPKIERTRNPLGGGIYVLGVAEVPKIGYGGRIGYLRNFGYSMMFVMGKTGPPSELINLEVPEFVVTWNITKRLVNTEDFKLHLYAGINQSNYPEYYKESEQQYWKEHYIGFDGGLIGNYKQLAFSIGVGTLQNNELSAYLGLGLRF